MNANIKKSLKIIFSIIIIFLFSSLTVYLIKITNNYPKGSDVYGHLFKINELYDSISNGVLYPIYSSNWYNSMELFRYWPAASYYFYNIFMFFTNGDIYNSFLLFTFAIYFLGAVSWLFYGIRENKIFYSLIIGLLWFYLPDNMRLYFVEGNIPRIFINALLPLLFFFISEALYYKKKFALIPMFFILVLIINSHIMISAMVGISIFLFLLVDAILNKRFKNQLIILVNCIFAYIVSAIILIPGLSGGLLSQNSQASVATSSLWSQELYKSFNPFIRFNDLTMFYFGLSILIIAILGMIVMHKKTFSGFCVCILIFLGTSTVFEQIISIVPFSQALWMTRFAPLALVLFFISLIQWKTLKGFFRYFFLFLIIIDSAISLQFLEPKESTYFEIEKELNELYFFDEAIEISSNRISLMDLGNLESYPSYYLALHNNYFFGWAYQGAYNIQNIADLNESFEKGFYLYTFDRLLEYGCDTVIIRKQDVVLKDFDYLDLCAKKLNYTKIDENGTAILYKLETEGIFGTINNYENAAIGKSSNYICYLYPEFHTLDNNNLDEYTFEDLKDYKKIYLSGFSYSNFEYVEKLLRQLSNAGVKIYIDMDNIPIDKTLGKAHLLGVYTQAISFTKEFPILEKQNGSQFKLPLKSDTEKWETVYLTKAQKVLRSSEYSDKKYLDYIGTDNNENIYFIGLNLIYYASDNNEVNLKNFLDEIFDINEEIVPNRQIVKLDVQYYNNKIIINSTEDNVNTNISNLPCFYTTSRISNNSGQLIVNSGETILEIRYTYLTLGLIVSIIGLLLYLVFLVKIFFLKGDFYEKKK